LGKTIALPGCWESSKVVSGACAKAGAAKPRAGINSKQKRAHFFNQTLPGLMVLSPCPRPFVGPSDQGKRHAMVTALTKS
jgi:hypothetical protein